MQSSRLFLLLLLVCSALVATLARPGTVRGAPASKVAHHGHKAPAKPASGTNKSVHGKPPAPAKAAPQAELSESNTEYISHGGNSWAFMIMKPIGIPEVVLEEGAVLKAFITSADRDEAHAALLALTAERFPFVAGLTAPGKYDGPCVQLAKAGEDFDYFRASRRKGSNTCYYIVMKNGGKTDVERCLHKHAASISKQTLKDFLKNMMRHVKTFHQAGWFHRDLQLKNIMVAHCLSGDTAINFIDNDIAAHIPERAERLHEFQYMFKDIQTLFGLGECGAYDLLEFFPDDKQVQNLQTSISNAYVAAFKSKALPIVDKARGRVDELELFKKDVKGYATKEPTNDDYLAALDRIIDNPFDSGRRLALVATYAQAQAVLAAIEDGIIDAIDAWSP